MATNHDPEIAIASSLLRPELHPRWALSPWHLAIVPFWCALYYLVNLFPLRETDLWGHVAYGNWILEHGALPLEDPFVSLMQGMKVIDAAWLSQVIYALVERVRGGEGLSGLFALTTLATYLLIGRTFYLQSRNLVVTHLAVVLVFLLGWSRVSTMRPENFGVLCFAILLWLTAEVAPSGSAAASAQVGRRNSRLRLWIGVPLLMVAWSNLHGSFVCGLLMLACFLGGAVIEVACRTRSPGQVLADPEVCRWLLLFELAVAATLVNPYGMDLLLNTLWFAKNENLHEITEWQPMAILEAGGREFAVSVVLMLFVFRHGRWRVPVAHVLLLAVFGASVLRGIRMIWWYAALVGLAVTPQLADIWERGRPLWSRKPVAHVSRRGWFGLPRERSWSYSWVALLLMGMTFAVSPSGRSLLTHSSRVPEELYTASTPWKLTEFLRGHPPQGQVMNPQWWGDWLLWDGPADIQLFMTTNLHLAPRQVWKDYRVVRETRSGWQNVLGRYCVQTVVLDKALQTTLLRYLRASGEWRIVYEDAIGMIFQNVRGDAMVRRKKAEPVPNIDDKSW
ncbi:MAG: hypothetical protein NTY19_37780 [Planctomycetota bacterium]|nr:hypothetical protein [Planctomycetota bacterium]